ncbi:molybdopterin-dependent oxidoreductase [bacterium]|nr:molybdopterin-dependent oxidoreductase [bacterium]
MTEEDKYQPGAPLTPAEAPVGAIISPDTHRSERIPPGQSRTRKWPVLQYGRIPEISTDRWRLELRGLVKQPLRFTWDEFQQLPRVQVFSDFHCVTRWSRLGNVWEGVSVKTVFGQAGILPEAKYVVATGYDDGWTTNLPLDDFLQDDVLIADKHDGEPLSFDHGGPVRLIVPRLYAWKSAKWLKAITLLDHDEPGLWEQAGYHMHGDPWTEERMWM